MPFPPPKYVRADINHATAGLVKPLVYEGRDDTFTIPAGFVTDFASVPRFLTWLVPTMGAYTRAAIVHDWLCTELEKDHQLWKHGPGLSIEAVMNGAKLYPPANARDTDGIFRRICREEGTPLVRRWLLWTGVRWGALFNPARRPGWLRTAPTVLGISLLALPLLLPATLLVLATLAIDRVVEAIR